MKEPSVIPTPPPSQEPATDETPYCGLAFQGHDLNNPPEEAAWPVDLPLLAQELPPAFDGASLPAGWRNPPSFCARYDLAAAAQEALADLQEQAERRSKPSKYALYSPTLGRRFWATIIALLTLALLFRLNLP